MSHFFSSCFFPLSLPQTDEYITIIGVLFALDFFPVCYPCCIVFVLMNTCIDGGHLYTCGHSSVFHIGKEKFAYRLVTGFEQLAKVTCGLQHSVAVNGEWAVSMSAASVATAAAAVAAVAVAFATSADNAAASADAASDTVLDYPKKTCGNNYEFTLLNSLLRVNSALRVTQSDIMRSK